MARVKVKAPGNREKEISTKRKIIVYAILLTIAFSGAFLIYYALRFTLNTSTPLVVVVSGSMEPNLHKGDLCFIKGRDPADIKNGTIEGKEGDIIVFDARGLWTHAPSDPIIHRVVGKWYDNGWFFETKGDANSLPDSEPVPETRVLGIVVGRIPYIGWVKIVLTDSGLLIPLLVIVSFLLVVSIIWEFLRKDKGEKKKNNTINFYDSAKIKKEIEIDYTKMTYESDSPKK
jgi:signal peptidase